MDTTTTAPAGAAAESTGAAGGGETVKVSAQVDAASKGDVSGFLEADRAARAGKPLEKVERPKIVARNGAAAPAGKGGEPAKGPRPADVAADERLTSRIREAVDTSTAELRRINADLVARLEGKGGQAAGKEKTNPGAGTVPPERNAVAEVKRFLAMPDAPKIEDFDSITDHNAAVSLFITGKQAEERAAADSESRSAFGRAEREIERVKTFHGRINAYKEKNPEFAKELTPEVGGLHGFGRLQQVNAERAQRGEAPIAATVDHAIGEEIYDSEAPAEIAVWLSKHPEDLAALRACRNPPALLRAFAKLEARVTGIPAAPAPATAGANSKQPAADFRSRAEAAVDRSVSSAPPPAPTLGKAGTQGDPYRKAVESGDVGMFLELDRQQMADRKGIGARR